MTMTSESVMTLGERIQSEMRRKRMSMRTLAKLIDASQPTVFKWIHDTNEPSLQSLKKMAVVFNVSPNWLIFGDEVEKEPVVKATEAPAAMIISEKGVSLINSSSCLYYSVTTDEMSPTLDIGSTVMVDRSVTSIIQSGIYLIDLSGDLILRRFRRSLDGSIRVSCDNSAKYSEIETLKSDEDLKILGKVVSKINIDKVS